MERTALVTGASKGIGAGIALSPAKEGAAVAVNYASDREGAGRVVEKDQSGRRKDHCCARKCDLNQRKLIAYSMRQKSNSEMWTYSLTTPVSSPICLCKTSEEVSQLHQCLRLKRVFTQLANAAAGSDGERQ
jgi:short chain dehydrogenase